MKIDKTRIIAYDKIASGTSSGFKVGLYYADNGELIGEYSPTFARRVVGSHNQMVQKVPFLLV